ncbi:hypothetical protein ACCO45_011802 [Purpureocillium lilacinum]|uniref:Uncharacterized protein n=1 Tax=Purpureocillium lilacinum TaxID=33203 RepID=A0ACC4DEG1_PURLI
MYIYVGKLNWPYYAENELITVVFPAGFSLLDPVSAYWQWTVDASGNEKQNNVLHGRIKTVTKAGGGAGYGFKVQFEGDYYAFDCTTDADDPKSLRVTVSSPDQSHAISSLALKSSDGSRVLTTSVFTGKLNYFQYAVNEMVTLILPAGIEDGKPVVLCFQWTEDDSGESKANHVVLATLRDVGFGDNGRFTGRFDDGYYTFDFLSGSSDSDMSMTMKDPDGKSDTHSPYKLTQTDFRNAKAGNKKALIVRYNTGIDEGIFMVKDMLVKYLGFSSNDVEVLYFDVDPKRGDGPKKTPTADNFKDRFTRLCSADPGDVRFVYVDVHGTTWQDEDGEGEPDKEDEGWILAEDKDGTRKEIVTDDWVADTLRKNLAPGVNFTILSSSCFGGGMLDTHSGTPGVLLASCHETQFNVKVPAIGTRDPFMLGVCATPHGRKRGVPTYAALYGAAKAFIRAQMTSEQWVRDRYLGPSRQEWKPEPFISGQATKMVSHQDPQLLFREGYLDPEAERFLCPFAGPPLAGGKDGGGGGGGGGVTRYPKDQYAHDEL